jgi:flagellin-like hook-associated protein FlgL
MAMIVQHNMQSMNSSRMLGVTTAAQAKSTEKLSSGYKINRAADDAAGLTISEKMRKQIRGLTQASTNAQDGVSSVQTAEGALTEVHSMLQRMEELSTQASNGTNSKGDRDAIQSEITQLTTEIDRVSETTKFNETYLLKGDNTVPQKSIYLKAHDAGLKGQLTDNGDGTAKFTMDKLEVGDKVMIGGKNYTIAGTAAEVTGKVSAAMGGNGTTYTPAAGDALTVNGVKYTYYAAGKNSNNVDFTAGFYTMNPTATQETAGSSAADLIKSGADVTANGKAFHVLNDAKDSTDSTKPGYGIDDNDTSIITAAKAYELAEAELLKANSIGDTESNSSVGSTIVTSAKIDTVANAQALIPTAPADGDTVTIFDKATKASQTLVYGNYDGTGAAWWDTTNADFDELKATAKVADPKTLVTAGKVVHSAQGTIEAAAAASATPATYEPALVASHKNSDPSNAQNLNVFDIAVAKTKVPETLSFNLHVGADGDMANKINISIDAMNANYLGIFGLDVSDDSGMNATYAIDAIGDAIGKVSSQRSALGAIQNRLEHTIANLDNIVENTTAAESRIRDTDMASEMVQYSKNNILAQAGQSMLAQANQATQGVLSLLK